MRSIFLMCSTLFDLNDESNVTNAHSLPGFDLDEPLPAPESISSVPTFKLATVASTVEFQDEKSVASSVITSPTMVEANQGRILSLYEDINVFFTQIRSSDVIYTLIKSLNSAKSFQHQKLVEKFIWLCWSRHPNLRLQLLMKIATVLLNEQKFEDALKVLDAVIKIDPKYTEAYNKRATLNFGLRKAHECFSDIDWVLMLQPYHYGALYAKALMFMKLESYQAAIYTFERASKINPLLLCGSLGRNISACKVALQAQQLHSQANIIQTPNQQRTMPM